MTYPLAFRKKVFEIKTKENLSYEETAERFGIGKSSRKPYKSDLTASLFCNISHSANYNLNYWTSI